MNGLAWLGAIETASIVVGGPLLFFYLRERVANLAREASEKTLADYRHQQERALAALSAEHQRRLQEFSLYAQKQHQVYAALYRRVREATDRFSSMIGLTSSPDFSTWDAAAATEFVARHHASGRLADEALAAYSHGDARKASAAMYKLHERIRLRDADSAFTRAPKELEKRDAMRAAVDALFATMREELRRGEAPTTPAVPG